MNDVQMALWIKADFLDHWHTSHSGMSDPEAVKQPVPAPAVLLLLVLLIFIFKVYLTVCVWT